MRSSSRSVARRRRRGVDAARSWSSAPIEPSKATTPQARTKAASVRGDDALADQPDAAGAGGEEFVGDGGGHAHDYRVGRREPRCEDPERILGDENDRDLRPRRRAGGLARGVPVLRELRARRSSACRRAPTRSCCRYIGPPFALRASASCSASPHDAPIVAACIDGYRERYATASLTETTVAPGIPEALDALRRPPRSRSRPPSRTRFAEPLLEAMGLREHFDVVAGPDLERPRRGQDRDARPRAARSSARRAR